jgi:DNA primase large subunit
MSTLQDLFEYVDRHKAKLVAWRQVTTFLQNSFVASDTSPPDKVLKLDDGRIVPEETIEEIIQEIYQAHIAPGEQKVRELLDSELDSALAKIREDKKKERKVEEEEPANLRKTKKGVTK